MASVGVGTIFRNSKDRKMGNDMNSAGLRSFQFLLFFALGFSAGCVSKGSTRLCGNFQSYQTVENVRAELSRSGQNSGWAEESQGTSPTDRRPPYKLIYLSGPFKLSGIDGRLRFTFLNGRLMETQFSPQNNDDYLAALRNEKTVIPQKPAEEVVMDRRTKFRLDVGPNGNLFFTWYDPTLEDEWKKWVASNA
jgi:hypothetical protein